MNFAKFSPAVLGHADSFPVVYKATAHESLPITLVSVADIPLDARISSSSDTSIEEPFLDTSSPPSHSSLQSVYYTLVPDPERDVVVLKNVASVDSTTIFCRTPFTETYASVLAQRAVKKKVLLLIISLREEVARGVFSSFQKQ